MKFSTIVAFIAAPLVANAAAIEQISDLEARQASGTSSTAPLLTNRAWITGALARINQYRGQHSAVPFQWNGALATYAQNAANGNAANGCQMAHTHGPYGEVIYYTSASTLNFAQATNDAFDAWMSEEPIYKSTGPSAYDNQPDTSKVPTGALHYTALMWKNSKRIGCGWSKVCNGGGFIFFCETDPQGNILGQFGANLS